MKQIRIKVACNLGRHYYAPGDIAGVADYLADSAVARGLADLYMGNTVPADGAENSEAAHAANAKAREEHPMLQRLRNEAPIAKERAAAIAEPAAVPVKKGKGKGLFGRKG